MLTHHRAAPQPLAAVAPSPGDGDSPRVRVGGIYCPFAEQAVIHEGRNSYREQFAPGAFLRSFVEDRDSIKLLLEHGADGRVRRLPLGRIITLREVEDGAFFEGELLRGAAYVAELVPAIDDALYQLSFSFVSERDSTTAGDRGAAAGDPASLPLVTRRKVRLREISLTVMPAYRSTRLARIGAMS